MNVISELDHPLITEEWIRLTTQKGRRTFALRLRNPWIDEATGTPRQKWILCSCGKLTFNINALRLSLFGASFKREQYSIRERAMTR